MASEEKLHGCVNQKPNQDSDLHSCLDETPNPNSDLHSCLDETPKQNTFNLKKFRLYETLSNYYLIGRDKNRTFWRVLKIDRTEPCELNIVEDPTTYSEQECYELLRRIHEGNKAVGGLKLITVCYGIIGFVRFLGPYYMLIITQRRKLGSICGHTIYGISKSKMIPVPNSTVRSKLPYSKDENRSFVHSACKCNVYMVLLLRNKRVASRTRHSLNVLRTVSWRGILLVRTKFSGANSFVSYHHSAVDSFYAEEVNFVLYLLIHLKCESADVGFPILTGSCYFDILVILPKTKHIGDLPDLNQVDCDFITRSLIVNNISLLGYFRFPVHFLLIYRDKLHCCCDVKITCVE